MPLDNSDARWPFSSLRAFSTDELIRLSETLIELLPGSDLQLLVDVDQYTDELGALQLLPHTGALLSCGLLAMLVSAIEGERRRHRSNDVHGHN